MERNEELRAFALEAGLCGHIWLGAQEKWAGNSGEGSWAWIGNHNPASTSSYTNWMSGRPNIASGGCARIFSLYSGVPNTWDDQGCDTTGPYVCYSPYS